MKQLLGAVFLILTSQLQALDYDIDEGWRKYTILRPVENEVMAPQWPIENKMPANNSMLFQKLYENDPKVFASTLRKNPDYKVLEQIYGGYSQPFISPTLETTQDRYLLNFLVYTPSAILLAKRLYHDLHPFIHRLKERVQQGKQFSMREFSNFFYNVSLRYALPLFLFTKIAGSIADEIINRLPYYYSTTTHYAVIVQIILKNLLIWYGPYMLTQFGKKAYQNISNKVGSVYKRMPTLSIGRSR